MFVVLVFGIFVFDVFLTPFHVICAVCPQRPSTLVVDFNYINSVINYNGAHKAYLEDHPRVAHNLLEYIPVDRDWIKEMPN